MPEQFCIPCPVFGFDDCLKSVVTTKIYTLVCQIWSRFERINLSQPFFFLNNQNHKILKLYFERIDEIHSPKLIKDQNSSS